MASVVGIGGGVIFGPLLLEVGINPEVAAGTSMFLEMYLTLTNTILLGGVPPQFALMIGFAVIIGSLSGLFILGKIMK